MIGDNKVQIPNADTYHGVQSYSGLSFSNANKALTLTAITYWYKGFKYTTTSTVTCDLDLTADRDNSLNTLTANTLYYFYFKNATGKLYWSDSVWAFKENVFVATVFWNGSAGACQNECHLYTRDLDWHIWAHETIGCRYESGSTLTAPTTSADETLQIETGTYHDEDINFITGQCTTMRGWYKTAASTYTFADYALPFIGLTTDPYWLDTDDYTLKSVGNSDYVCCWIYATNDIDRHIYVIPTQAATAHDTLTLARAETTPQTLNANINAEMKLIFKFIYRGDGQFQEFVDYRSSSPVPGGGTPTVSAGSVSFIPYSTLASTNVQSAIQELLDEAGGGGGSYLFSYLSAGSDTTALTNNASYYHFVTTFTTSPVSNFTASNPVSFAYNGATTKNFKISWSGTFKINNDARLLTFALMKNSSVLAESMIEEYFVTSAQSHLVGGECVVSLATDDAIAPVINSDTNGDTSTIMYFQITVSELF